MMTAYYGVPVLKRRGIIASFTICELQYDYAMIHIIMTEKLRTVKDIRRMKSGKSMSVLHSPVSTYVLYFTSFSISST